MQKEIIKRLCDALLNLLYKTEYNNISVKMICKEANVNRSSFYRNYNSIDELMNDLKIYIDDLFVDFQGADSNLLSNDKMENEANIERFLYFIKTNQYIFKAIHRNMPNASIKNIFTQMLCKYVYNQFEDNKYFNNKFNHEFFLIGTEAVIFQWINSGCVDECALIAECINNYVNMLRLLETNNGGNTTY